MEVSSIFAVEGARIPLFGDFQLRGMPQADFQPLWRQHMPKVFEGHGRVDVSQLMSEGEKQASERLAPLFSSACVVRFGIFHREDFVGWHIGDATSRDEFYMRNSGVFQEFRRRELYRAMLKAVLPFLMDRGFQVITSRHNATNNAVIIPKLQAGFVITGLQVTDRFGTLVSLQYFANQRRRALMDYRCGLGNPEDAVCEMLGLGQHQASRGSGLQ